jgi:hypothetical protein
MGAPAEQRLCVGNFRAGPRDRPGAERTGKDWWGRGGRLAPGFSSASRAQQQGRAIRGRAAHRVRAGRQNAGNSPAYPTSPFSPQSACGEPRHVGLGALSTTSARSHALFCGFSYKNFAGTGPIARLRVVWLQNPCRGTRCACFRECARVFGGGSLGDFLRERVFWRFVLQLFRHTGSECVPTLQDG